ncbi:hypothetical protein [Chryseobacterium sp. WLY505]|uniref:hypothetical protein n=1 Tax=Chryseobacterium sp. WLY505 TaxID=3068892 RepID=UPI00279670DD|nr:hypothetical protein [Chryseobacterium sp. WLY505]MDQ1857316.1 hypothetical protein [Chryseobacterium sp. WLY505]
MHISFVFLSEYLAWEKENFEIKERQFFQSKNSERRWNITAGHQRALYIAGIGLERKKQIDLLRKSNSIVK